MTVSVLREAFSRLLALSHLTLPGIVRELNATMRRTEEARIYHWVNNVEEYPPRRTRESATTARQIESQEAPNPPNNDS